MANLESGFVKADSGNLPQITFEMITEFMLDAAQFLSVEFRGQKFNRSTRETYGDNAVGYVQLKRTGTVVTCLGRITLETKVRAKPYTVRINIDEVSAKILEIQCDDCKAACGGCKHGIAFVFWLHRRSEEKAVTEVTCYWKKSELSKVGTQKKFIKLSELTTVKKHEANTSATVMTDFLQTMRNKAIDCTLLNTYKPIHAFSVHQLLIDYLDTTSTLPSADSFLEYCTQNMDPVLCNEAGQQTEAQSASQLWFELRYGRITASKLHEASNCNTYDGSLVKRICGASKFIPTAAMQRGLRLEGVVIREVEKLLHISAKPCGLLVTPETTIFGASPDAVTADAVIEVKCPQKTIESFVKNGRILDKFDAQMQLQMKLYKKATAIFAVADPGFEKNQKVHIFHVAYDEGRCKQLMENALTLWKTHVFSVLARSR